MTGHNFSIDLLILFERCHVSTLNWLYNGPEVPHLANMPRVYQSRFNDAESNNLLQIGLIYKYKYKGIVSGAGLLFDWHSLSDDQE